MVQQAPGVGAPSVERYLVLTPLTGRQREPFAQGRELRKLHFLQQGEIERFPRVVELDQVIRGNH